MTLPAPPSLETRVRSNEKLLMALITLLALKDERLLSELRVVFTLAAAQDLEIGKDDPAVWADILRKLSLVDGLVNREGGGDRVEGANAEGASLQ